VRSGQSLIVAIDGPSGVGKTTVARAVARRLGLPYLETGAMYRALGFKALESGLDPADATAAETLARQLDLTATRDAAGTLTIRLDGKALEESIRSAAVGEITSRLAVHPGVRRVMVALQREWGARYGAVVEGRDIGTRVFPNTPHKFFLTAPDAVRVRRRLHQLHEQGVEASAGEVELELQSRDERDRDREESPLRWDETYCVLDTAALSKDQVVDRIVAAVRDRLRAQSSDG
jgi:cytidylate kinase